MAADDLLQPANMVEVMTELASWMDLLDQMVETLSKFTDREPPYGAEDKSIQADLRMWAEWFREHPDVDSAMFAVSSLAIGEPS